METKQIKIYIDEKMFHVLLLIKEENGTLSLSDSKIVLSRNTDEILKKMQTVDDRNRVEVFSVKANYLQDSKDRFLYRL